MKCSFDPLRLMKFSKVIDNQICFDQKEAFNLYQLFHCRFSLFKQVYTHKTSTAIEYMMLDIFNSAESYLNLAEKVKSIEKFAGLSDSILHMIERSNAPSTLAARNILHRIRKRNLYRFTDALILPYDMHDHPAVDGITKAAIKDACKSNAVLVDDIIIQKLVLNYAMKDKNPVDSVKFYSKFDSQIAVPTELM
jgi:deoxynucleoside triphosphate triphosphohydrolase SAMHD1